MFLDLLKMHIEEKGYRFSYIAKYLGKSVSYVNEVHKGRREIKVDDIIKFSDALDLNFKEKTEFIELYLSEKYPELFNFLKLKVNGVDSVEVLEKDQALDKKASNIETSSHIPVIHSKIKGIISIKLTETILEDIFEKNNYLILKLKEDNKIDDENLDKYILYLEDNKLKADKLILKNENYHLFIKDTKIDENIEVIGYIIGKYLDF